MTFKIAFSFLRQLLLLMAIGMISAENLMAQEVDSQSDRDIARAHITALKGGALLVRLQTRAQSLETLKERGLTDKAEELERRQVEENLEYVKAFISEFDFAPVYFFRSEDSKLVKEGRLSEVVFLNDDLVADSSITVEERSIYTAEFGNVAPDDEKMRQDYRLDKDSTGVKQKATYYGSADMGFEALVIMDDQFIQLRNPFPYYVRTYDKKGIITRSAEKAVRKLNQKLHQFY
ncbi:hypothetical protein O3Q51_14805 [Cryomorphaceae bacterium 1068]|nr:hypothetical protein [Cryomorphaceae bacterium 1068]